MIKIKKNSPKWKICTQLAFEISDNLNFDKRENSIKKVHINPQELSVTGYTQGHLLVLWAYLKQEY